MSAIANSNQPEDKPKTSQIQSYWQSIPWKKLASLLMVIALGFSLTACGGQKKSETKAPLAKLESINIAEVSPPSEIQRLSNLLDQYEPKISILSPKPNEVLNDAQVSIKFDVKNLPIFKNADLGLGPHIHVALDNQEYKALYDLNQTVNFDNLAAGTHTIRAFASRPWHESFKNQGAYAQVTFHVFTKTDENSPDPKTPLLTYSRPVGTYGAEPIMLDFYLQNAPLHLLASDEESIDDWQIRATVDGQSFTFDRWEPIYLKGFKTGKNWVKLELIDTDGDRIDNVYNSTAHVINFQPDGTDTLSRLVRGEKIANIEAILNPNYVPPAPEVVAPEVVAPEVVAPDKVAPNVVAPVEKKEETSEKAPEQTSSKVTEKVLEKPTEPAKPTESPKAISVPVVVPETKPVPVIPAPIKVTPAPVKAQTPVPLPPVKSSPVEPAKSIPANPVSDKSSKTTPTDSPTPAKPVAPKSYKDYLKESNFSPRKPSKTEAVDKSDQVPDKVSSQTSDGKEQSKPSDNPPVLTDLSTTSTTPIKVLNK